MVKKIEFRASGFSGFLFFVLLVSTGRLIAQPGCTDPNALNFDVEATQNDGSCLYPPTHDNLEKITNLENDLKECSGLVKIHEQLWAHNDGGNPPELFLLDSASGAILRKVVVSGVQNTDWEDLAIDDENIYVGDFGNNLGSRRDLKIYKIPLAKLSRDTVVAETIYFRYADQRDFSPRNTNHNFDCESLVTAGDSLVLFTKNWEDNFSRFYVLPKNPGNYSISPRDSFFVEGTLTGADILGDTSIVLLGYTRQGQVFAWMLWDFPPFRFFSGNKRKIQLGNAVLRGQTEGVAFSGVWQGWIGAEEFSILPPQLWTFDFRKFLEPVSPVFELESSDFLTVFPNPFGDSFIIRKKMNVEIRWIELYDNAGKLIWKKRTIQDSDFAITTRRLDPGTYFLRAFLNNALFVKKIVKK